MPLVCFACTACLFTAFSNRKGAICDLSLSFQRFPRNVEYLNIVTVVKYGGREKTQLWDRYYAMPGSGGLARVDDQLTARGVVGREGIKLMVRPESKAVRYGFVFRTYSPGGARINDDEARVYWILPEELADADRIGKIDIPPFDGLPLFDFHSLR
jgi:hypothetical protein